MKEEVAKEWTAALRSGQYEQGTGALRTGNDRYCCLGVLCELAVAKGIIPAPRQRTHSPIGHYRYGKEDNSAFLPSEVQKWADINNTNPTDPESRKSLAYFNDDGRSFAEIAEIIDRNWQEL